MRKKYLMVAILPTILFLSACGAKDQTENVSKNMQKTETQVKKIDVSTAYGLNEVAKHATPTDCWTVVNGKVYNLTNGINQHPGGPTPIESLCGLDRSTMFNMQHGSMPRPNEMLNSFQIGILTIDPNSEKIK